MTTVLAAEVAVLREHLATLRAARNLRSIAIVGQVPGAGTSTVAWLLARACAAVEAGVVLADAAFARPGLQRLAGATAGPGLDAADPAAPPAATPAPADPAVAFVPSGGGGRPRQADAWRALFAKLGSGLLLIDAGAVSDASAPAVAAGADACVLVVPAGRVPVAAVAHAGERLAGAGARPAGCVLNRRRFPVPRLLYRFL